MITADERKLLDSVSIDEPWKLVETFSTWVREHPNDVNRAMDHLVGRLKSFGMPVTVYEPALYLSLPGKARVEAGGKSYRAKPPSFSKPAPQGLSGELVYIPAKRSADIDNVFDMKLDKKVDHSSRVRGKIVISEGFASPGIVSQFQGIGAIGVIAVNHGADIHWGTCASIWGAPELDNAGRKAGIPAVAVNNPDGKALIELARQGGKVTIISELEERWFPANKLPVVEIKGSEEPEKYVLLHGHLDSWDVGVGDNAVGDAALLEIARVLWLHRSQLKRSVRIAWWPGHSTGRYAGSTWFANLPSIWRRTASPRWIATAPAAAGPASSSISTACRRRRPSSPRPSAMRRARACRPIAPAVPATTPSTTSASPATTCCHRP
jgi:hypothetical protein